MNNRLNISRFKVGDKVLVTRTYSERGTQFPKNGEKGQVTTVEVVNAHHVAFETISGLFTDSNPFVFDSDYILLKDLSKLGKLLYL